MTWSLFDNYGRRKYLNTGEVQSLLQVAQNQPDNIHAFCRLLAETGCRISEALATTESRVDASTGQIAFECLKKRRKGIFRVVPISTSLADLLLSLSSEDPDAPLWSWCRMTGYRRVCELLTIAQVRGPQATPKGLRHGFAVASLGAGVPLNLLQRWLGHADIRTTSIYASASGPEERAIAERVWKHFATSKRGDGLGKSHHAKGRLEISASALAAARVQTSSSKTARASSREMK